MWLCLCEMILNEQKINAENHSISASRCALPDELQLGEPKRLGAATGRM